MKTEQDIKIVQGLQVQPEHAVGTFYRVGWKEGDRGGTQDDVYTSFISAVAAAEHAHQLAQDRSLPYTFSVLDGTNKTVYTCQ